MIGGGIVESVEMGVLGVDAEIVAVGSDAEVPFAHVASGVPGGLQAFGDGEAVFGVLAREPTAMDFRIVSTAIRCLLQLV
jgi:hypothetical protein